MTEDEVSGNPGAKLVAGCMFASHGAFKEEAGSWDIYPQFIHNPWADQPLPNGLFDPIPEYQVVDGVSAGPPKSSSPSSWPDGDPGAHWPGRRPGHS